MTPSNANTSGLEVSWVPDAKNPNDRRLYVDGNQWAKVYGWDKASLDARCAVIETSLVSQARIADLEAELSQANANGALHWSRATAAEARIATILEGDCGCCVLTRAACADTVAEIEIGRKSAEARADRLAKALERIASGHAGCDDFQDAQVIASTALQQSASPAEAGSHGQAASVLASSEGLK